MLLVKVQVKDLGGFSASEVGVTARKSRPFRQMLTELNKAFGGIMAGIGLARS